MTLLFATVMFLYDVHEVVLGDKPIVMPQSAFLFFPPLLLIEVRRVEELWRQDGSCRFYPVHHSQEQTFVVVVEKRDGCSSVAQTTRSAYLNGKIRVWSVQHRTA